VLSPSAWEVENVAFEERLERLDHSIGEIRRHFVDAVSILAVIYAAGLVFAVACWLRPNLGAAVLLCLAPLFATPVATEPLIGVDNMHLFYLTLPMLIAACGVVLIEAGHAIDASLAGPRSEAWGRVWMGLAMIVAGAAATALGFALSEALNPGSIVVVVGPILYGIFSVLWGLGGLLRRPR
jgi:hypothetical protein